MSGENALHGEPTTYCIRVKGKLDETWSGWFNGLILHLESEDPLITLLTGSIVDQAKLRGILNKLWDLNLTILSVNLMDGDNDFGSSVGRDPNEVATTKPFG